MPSKSKLWRKGGRRRWQTCLQMAFSVEEQILRFNIPVSDTLAMKIEDAMEHLLEAAFSLTRTHASVKKDYHAGPWNIGGNLWKRKFTHPFLIAAYKSPPGQNSMTSHQCRFSSCTRSTVSTTLGWCKVDEIQNSAVSFFTYSFSDSFLRRLRNSWGEGYEDVRRRSKISDELW